MDADLPTPEPEHVDLYDVDDEDEDETSVVRLAAEPGDEAVTADDGQRLDLDAISADLEGVEVALARLSDGTYWTDEVTGEQLPDSLLASSPTARHA